jgi:acyl-CoA synthetase (AMP-forming)/AMP-acid ligase II
MRFTYGQLNGLANRVANALVEMKIGRGDKVALSCPNLPFFPIVYYGILKAGAAVVPLNVLFKPRESPIICAIRTRKPFLFLKARRNFRLQNASKKVLIRLIRAKI